MKEVLSYLSCPHINYNDYNYCYEKEKPYPKLLDRAFLIIRSLLKKQPGLSLVRSIYLSNSVIAI